MSEITDIYKSLAGLQVSLSDGTTPYAYNLDELPEAITTAQLPCRLLLRQPAVARMRALSSR